MTDKERIFEIYLSDFERLIKLYETEKKENEDPAFEAGVAQATFDLLKNDIQRCRKALAKASPVEEVTKSA